MLFSDRISKLFRQMKPVIPTRFITASGRVVSADECGRHGLIVLLPLDEGNRIKKG
jgi:hypothetical protein